MRQRLQQGHNPLAVARGYVDMGLKRASTHFFSEHNQSRRRQTAGVFECQTASDTDTTRWLSPAAAIAYESTSGSG